MTMLQKPSSASTGTAAGVVSTLEIYTLEEAKRRLKWSDAAVRSAKRNGLRLIKCGKRKYLAGQEIFRFLESISQSE